MYLYLRLKTSGRRDGLVLVSSPGRLGCVVRGIGAMNSHGNRTLMSVSATHKDLNEIAKTYREILNLSHGIK